MRKIIEILFIIIILGIISGIIPFLGLMLLYKYPILIIPVLILDIYWIMYELCINEGE